jgi:hypothetical protein
MATAQSSPPLALQQLAFNRGVLLAAHMIAATVTVLAYLARVDFTAFQYWGKYAGVWVICMAIPPLFPYVMSVVHSRKLATASRLGVWMFVIVLAIGAILMVMLLLGAFGLAASAAMILSLFFVQTLLYFFAAKLLVL